MMKKLTLWFPCLMMRPMRPITTARHCCCPPADHLEWKLTRRQSSSYCFCRICRCCYCRGAAGGCEKNNAVSFAEEDNTKKQQEKQVKTNEHNNNCCSCSRRRRIAEAPSRRAFVVVPMITAYCNCKLNYINKTV